MWFSTRAGGVHGRRFAVVLALTATLAGCANLDAGDADGETQGPDTTGAALEIGTSARSFELVPPTDGTVELVHGPQGGYHIYGRYRFRGLTPDVYVTFRLTPAAGGAALNDTSRRVRRADQRGLHQVEGEWECAFPELIVLAIRSPDEVVGQRLRWELSVQDATTGRVLTSTREVTVVDGSP